MTYKTCSVCKFHYPIGSMKESGDQYTCEDCLGAERRMAKSTPGKHYIHPSAELRHALDQVSQLTSDLSSTKAKLQQLETEIEGLRRDRERLDWLDKRTEHIYSHFKYHPSLAATQKTWRQAIDIAITAAMKETK